MMVRFALMLGFVLFGAGCSPRPPSVNLDGRALESIPPAEDLDPSPSRLEVRLVAERASDGSYRYSGQRPGPTLRANVGDEVVVHLDNQLDAPTTIHWHGVGVPNEMDGVPFVTGVVEPGQSFTYRFRVERPGTFWYHPHFDTARQVDLGLYGFFIVEDPAAPELEELLVVLDGPDELVAHPVHGHGKADQRWTVNGVDAPALVELPRGARLRTRVLNASNTGYLLLNGRNLGVSAIAGDQGFDGGPRSVPILLGPGDRAELELSVEADGAELLTHIWSLNGGRVPWLEPKSILQFQVATPSAAPAAPSWPYQAPTPSPDPGHADIVWTLIGSDRSGFWTIDGEVFPAITPRRLPLGAAATIEIRNMSPTEHPFHLHGLPFELLSINARVPAFRTVEDTINVRIRERVRLRVRASRRGTWMAHCHILPHAEDGMMTLLIVE